MPEYIDRDKTIEEFKTCGAVFTYGVDVCNGVISRLIIQPAADVAPVVHGKWEYKEERGMLITNKCSICGQILTTMVGEKKNYCPNCGAKMQNE